MPPRSASRRASRLLPAGVGALLLVSGAAWLVQADLAARREAFDTDARIVHRLLSQQAAQHDAVLATLALLQPGQEPTAAAPQPRQPAVAAAQRLPATAPEQRLPALYPQVLQVLRRSGDAPWPLALAQAEADSAARRRPVLAVADLALGQITLVQAGRPTSYALRIDVDAAVPWADWPLARDGPVRVALRHGDVERVLQPGSGPVTGWRLAATKRLASDSQPLDVVVKRALHVGELPWGRLLLWTALVAALVAGWAAWQRQRDATRRAQELLRLGQVGRLNALGELAAGMAHELNQPLTAVLASTQAAQRLLDDGDDGGPDLVTVRQALAQSVQQARRAAEVVARLRRLVQGTGDAAATRPLPLAEVVRSVLYLLAPQIDAQAVATELHDLDGAPPVLADPVALEQIVHNLVLNALQALSEVPAGQRRLRLTAAASADGRVALRVHDSGPGFTPQALARAFEPFHTTRADGLGLGLSLCESLATGMGGTLTARNAEGGGAELTLVLPAVDSNAPVSTA